MPNQAWGALLNTGAPWQTTAGTALSTATTATISPQAPTAQDFILPSFYAGLAIRVTARGFITTTGTSTTATFLLAANQSGTYTTLATTAGLTTGTTVIAGIQWEIGATVRCTAVGSTGNTLSTQGALHMPVNITAPTVGTANGIILPMPNASGENAAAVNTFLSTAIVLRATLAGANATIQCTQYLLEYTD